jgi:3-oxoadipate enol-lactonase
MLWGSDAPSLCEVFLLRSDEGGLARRKQQGARQMAYVSRGGGVELYYEVYGELGSPAVVFLNGMTQTTANWKTLARAMSGAWRVIVYDARGQGKTSAGEQALSLSLHASDVVALLDEVGEERASLVGFSHGARVALATAGEHGGRVERLVVCSATARPSALAQTIVRSWREVLRTGGLEAMSWCALPAILGEEFLASSTGMLEGVIRASVQRNNVEGVSRLLDGLLDPDAYSSLAELATRVEAESLVICADADLLVTVEGARELASVLGARVEVVAGCGHTVPIERPREFRELVESFLRGVGSEV